MLRTDTPEEQLIHYPHARARAQARARDGYRADPWPDRAAWTAKRHDVNGITADNVRNGVSACAAEYATETEIHAAAGELDTAWTAAGKTLRDANKAANAVFPFHGNQKVRYAVWMGAYEALTAEQRALVEYATQLRGARKHVHEQAAALRKDWPLSRWSVPGAGDLVNADSCPTYMAIVDRIAAAGDKAAADYVTRIQSLPVDDEAWAKELASREKKEAWFRDGPIVRRYSAETADAR
ncbi:MAG TPA: hypothetical protein VK547_09675 [Candidatus Udaeobacter sp.]|nr:hypothetical protein [Candidatus Udaeobacter sp.]